MNVDIFNNREINIFQFRTIIILHSIGRAPNLFKNSIEVDFFTLNYVWRIIFSFLIEDLKPIVLKQRLNCIIK